MHSKLDFLDAFLKCTQKSGKIKNPAMSRPEAFRIVDVVPVLTVLDDYSFWLRLLIMDLVLTTAKNHNYLPLLLLTAYD